MARVPWGRSGPEIIKWSLIGPHDDVTCCCCWRRGADQSDPLNGRCLYQQASDWPKVYNLCASCHLLLGEWKIIYHCVHILFFNIWILDALDMVNMCHEGGGPMQGIALMFWKLWQSGALKLMSTYRSGKGQVSVRWSSGRSELGMGQVNLKTQT